MIDRISVNAPSYKRPVVETLKYVPNCRVWVCESEAEDYRKGNPGADIVAVPVGVQGNLCRIRNWILDREYERGIEAVCLIDDDLRGIQYYEKMKRIKVQPSVFPSWVEFYTDLAEAWGVKLWGVNCNTDLQSYREYTPFSTLSYIGGPFSVHIRSEMRYDERLPLKEDYDMTLQHLNRYRGVLRLNKFSYIVKQGGSGNGQAGGCATYRNVKNETDQLTFLQKKWGDKIVKYDNNDRSHSRIKKQTIDINPVLSAPIRGV